MIFSLNEKHMHVSCREGKYLNQILKLRTFQIKSTMMTATSLHLFGIKNWEIYANDRRLFSRLAVLDVRLAGAVGCLTSWLVDRLPGWSYKWIINELKPDSYPWLVYTKTSHIRTRISTYLKRHQNVIVANENITNMISSYCCFDGHRTNLFR